MKIESASCDGAEITGENWDISTWDHTHIEICQTDKS